MVPVASLLNPSSPSMKRNRRISLSPSPCTSPYSPSLLPVKKQKMSRGATTFVKGKPKGEVNFPPFELQDQDTVIEHQKYEVKPIGQIGEYPKRIPYSSDKKSFQLKTGRDGFEVYHYTFRMPGDDRNKDAHCVMWDYNIGLVRVTALFKSMNHPKTMPAKVMNSNPGLRDISHSITGGSISAQGYWVPFEAAKAVAARLCYEIRYVLVPVFGPDFVAMCHKPGGPDYQNLAVDPNIIRRCKEGAMATQTQSRESSLTRSPPTPSGYTELPLWPPQKSLRPKPIKAADVESGYGTDTDRSDIYSSYPGSPSSAGWTPVNTPKMLNLDNFRFPPHPKNITSTPRVIASPPSSSIAATSKRARASEDASDEESPSVPSSVKKVRPRKRGKVDAAPSPKMTAEIGAAFTLMQLTMADAALAAEKKQAIRRRRASA